MKIIDSFKKKNGQCQGLNEAAHSERGMDCTVIPLGRQVECSRRRCDAISRRLQSGRPIDSTAHSRWAAVHRCCCQCLLLTTIASSGPNRSGPKGRWWWLVKSFLVYWKRRAGRESDKWNTVESDSIRARWQAPDKPWQQLPKSTVW